MIRMRRNSSNGENGTNGDTAVTETAETNGQAAANFSLAANNSMKRSGVISESESMARDIKEGRLSGYVGTGTVLTGETNFQSMLRVDGHITGRVTSKEGTLIVGSTGQVDANVDVAAAVISGTVNGDVITSERLDLGPTAKVVGNITTPRLLIADGAILEGGCNMVESKEAIEQKAVKQQQQLLADESSTYSYGSSTSYEETKDEESNEADELSEDDDESEDNTDSDEDADADS